MGICRLFVASDLHYGLTYMGYCGVLWYSVGSNGVLCGGGCVVVMWWLCSGYVCMHKTNATYTYVNILPNNPTIYGFAVLLL